LFHHRAPTSTENTEETAHPFLVSNPKLKFDYYLIHNGVIGNCSKLKDEHEKLGFEYSSEITIESTITRFVGKKKQKQIVETTQKVEFNDSESLAIEFALFNEGLKKEIDCIGSIAFIALQVDKKTKEVVATHYGRGTNPIKYFHSHGLLMLTSESTDQGALDVQDGFVFTINRKDKDNSLTQRETKIGSFSQSGSSGRSGTHSGHDSYFDYPPARSTVVPTDAIGYDTTRGQNDKPNNGAVVIDIPVCSVEDNNKDVKLPPGTDVYHELAKESVYDELYTRCGTSGETVRRCIGYGSCHRHRRERKVRLLAVAKRLNPSVRSPYQEGDDYEDFTTDNALEKERDKIEAALDKLDEVRDICKKKVDEYEHSNNAEKWIHWTDQLERVEKQLSEKNNEWIAICNKLGWPVIGKKIK